jgi:galactose-1-phosphate uridylyltransferase
MSLASYTLNPSQQVPKGTGFGGMSQEELLNARDEIDELLTETRLKDVNISKELLLQLKKAKLLQKNTEEEQDVPANQRAQVQNSLGTVLTNLAKHQQATYTSERFKMLETAIIKCVKTLPTEAQTKFFELYMSEAEIGLS